MTVGVFQQLFGLYGDVYYFGLECLLCSPFRCGGFVRWVWLFFLYLYFTISLDWRMVIRFLSTSANIFVFAFRWRRDMDYKWPYSEHFIVWMFRTMENMLSAKFKWMWQMRFAEYFEFAHNKIYSKIGNNSFNLKFGKQFTVSSKRFNSVPLFKRIF